jgi:hypothetical protein
MKRWKGLEQLARNATPGPWWVSPSGGVKCPSTDHVCSDPTATAADLQFIAAANPEAVLALIVEWHMLQQQLATYRRALEKIVDMDAHLDLMTWEDACLRAQDIASIALDEDIA